MKQRIANKLVSIASKPGPKTAEAKNRVRLNSYQHGLTGQHLIIHATDRPDYDKAAEAFRQRFQPADGFEHELLQKIIDTNWRLNVCASIESAMFADVPTDQWTKPDPAGPHTTHLKESARAFLEQANSFGILGRYEAGLHRRFVGMMRELEAAIANRPEPEEPLAEAVPAPEVIIAPPPPEPAKPLAMAAGASTQPQQNATVTPEIDLLRSNSQQSETPVQTTCLDAVVERPGCGYTEEKSELTAFPQRSSASANQTSNSSARESQVS